MGWLSSIAALGVGILATTTGTAFGAPPLGETNSFVALQLKVTASEVTLVQALQFPGKAKPEPQTSGLDFVLRSRDGAIISKGTIENPRFQRSCSEEVPGSGTLKQVTSTSDEAVTVLRFPAGLNVGSVEFSETPRPGARLGSAPKSLGKISLKTP